MAFNQTMLKQLAKTLEIEDHELIVSDLIKLTKRSNLNWNTTLSALLDFLRSVNDTKSILRQQRECYKTDDKILYKHAEHIVYMHESLSAGAAKIATYLNKKYRAKTTRYFIQKFLDENNIKKGSKAPKNGIEVFEWQD